MKSLKENPTQPHPAEYGCDIRIEKGDRLHPRAVHAALLKYDLTGLFTAQRIHALVKSIGFV